MGEVNTEAAVFPRTLVRIARELTDMFPAATAVGGMAGQLVSIASALAARAGVLGFRVDEKVQHGPSEARTECSCAWCAAGNLLRALHAEDPDRFARWFAERIAAAANRETDGLVPTATLPGGLLRGEVFRDAFRVIEAWCEGWEAKSCD